MSFIILAIRLKDEHAQLIYDHSQEMNKRAACMQDYTIKNDETNCDMWAALNAAVLQANPTVRHRSNQV